MNDANVLEKRMRFLVFTSQSSLHGKNFGRKLGLNKLLEIMKFLKHFRFMFKEIDPHKFSIISNKSHKIFLSSNRIWGRAPHILKH
jgi:hypothetical protein